MEDNREKLSKALEKRGYKNEDLINEIEEIYKDKKRKPPVFSGKRSMVREELWSVLSNLEGNTADAYYDIIDIFAPVMRKRINPITIQDIILDHKEIIKAFVDWFNDTDKTQGIINEKVDEFYSDKKQVWELFYRDFVEWKEFDKNYFQCSECGHWDDTPCICHAR